MTESHPLPFNSDLEALILLCNSQALEYTAEKQYSEALALLRKAESYFDHPLVREVQNPTKSHLIGVTMTNLGCYYKEIGKLKVAVHYLSTGLEQLQGARISVKETVRAQVTLCAVQSSLKQHSTALFLAQAAIDLLENQKPGEVLLVERVSAYQNAGNELEHLGRLPESVEMYRKGLSFAEQHLPSHPLESLLRKSFEIVRRRCEAWTEKASSRREMRETRKVPTHFATVRTSPVSKGIGSRVATKLPVLGRVRTSSTSRAGRPMESMESAYTLRV